MKKFIALLVALAFSACAVFANNLVTLTWDFNDPEEEVTAYRMYEVSGGDLILKAVVHGDTNIVTLAEPSPGRRTYVVKAVNYWGESPASNEARTPPPGQAPKDLKLEK